MKIKTSRFGELDIDSGKIIYMPEGILGFPAYKRYIILETECQGPFVWLQAVDKPELAFIVIDPLVLDENFDAPVYPKDLSVLNAGSKKDISFLLIVTVRRDDVPPSIMANLQGPLAINMNAFIGRQLVLHPSEISNLAPANVNLKKNDKVALCG